MGISNNSLHVALEGNPCPSLLGRRGKLSDLWWGNSRGLADAAARSVENRELLPELTAVLHSIKGHGLPFATQDYHHVVC